VNGAAVGWGQVAATLGLVALAAAVSFGRGARLEGDLGVAALRSFVQLTAVGYVIKAIFDSDSLWVVALLLTAMVVVGTLTARRRAHRVPDATVPLFVALAVAAAATLGLVLALGIFDPKPRYLVPVGGMVIGNAMTAAAVSLNRLADDVDDQRVRIEATLALGASPAQAIRDFTTRGLRSGLIPLIDQTKTTGLVAFPGVLVGSLVAGAQPVDAVRLQLVLLWVLLGAVSLSALIATELGYRGFFTPAEQLREPAA
jgi:putative ABC transport system permease protein